MLQGLQGGDGESAWESSAAREAAGRTHADVSAYLLAYRPTWTKGAHMLGREEFSVRSARIA